MSNVYDVIYLNNATKHMGNMLHDAVLEYGYDGDVFLRLFLQSGVAEQIEIGNPKYIAGYSGMELFAEVVRSTEGDDVEQKDIEFFEKSDVYWVGWVLAYYQWYSGRSFFDILENVTYDELLGKYDVLHEADVQTIFDVLDADMIRTCID